MQITKDIGWGEETADSAFPRFERMAHKIALDYKRNYEFEDAMQAASEGFTKAFHKYDATKGTKFSTIVYKYMKGAVLALRRNNELVHFSESVRELASKVWRDDMKDASLEEIQSKYKVTENRAKAMFANFQRNSSLNEKIPTEDGDGMTESLDLMGNDQDFSMIIVNDFFQTLTESELRSLQIVMQGYSYREASKMDTVSEQRVRQRILSTRKRWKSYVNA